MIGLGTQLDTARFRSLIAEALELPPTQVSALILGEHGDSMVPIWSAAQAAGLPLEQFPGWNSSARRGDPHAHARQRRRGDQAQGGRGLRRRALDPRSRPRGGARPEADPAGLVARQRALRPPRRLHLGPDGRRPQRASKASSRSSSGPRKSRRLQHSAQVLRETIDAVFKSNPKAAGKAKPGAPSAPPVRSRDERRRRSRPGAGHDGRGGRQRRAGEFPGHRLRTRQGKR